MIITINKKMISRQTFKFRRIYVYFTHRDYLHISADTFM